MKLNKMASRREFLEQMPTQELDKMLQTELQKETMDEDLIRLILDVLESREMDYPVEYSPDVIEASKKLEDISASVSRKAKYPRALKAASILLVVGLLLFALPRVVHAENIFDLLARWTDNVFEFFNPSKPNDQPEYVFSTDNPGLQQIYDSVIEIGITDPVVPMWIPECFDLHEIEMFETPTDAMLVASIKNQYTDGFIIYTVIIHNNEIPFQYTKNQSEVEVMEFFGVEHYIVSDNKKTTVTWKIDSAECSVVTDCQDEDLQTILKSIYTAEVY